MSRAKEVYHLTVNGRPLCALGVGEGLKVNAARVTCSHLGFNAAKHAARKLATQDAVAVVPGPCPESEREDKRAKARAERQRRADEKRDAELEADRAWAASAALDEVFGGGADGDPFPGGLKLPGYDKRRGDALRLYSFCTAEPDGRLLVARFAAGYVALWTAKGAAAPTRYAYADHPLPAVQQLAEGGTLTALGMSRAAVGRDA